MSEIILLGLIFWYWIWIKIISFLKQGCWQKRWLYLKSLDIFGDMLRKTMSWFYGSWIYLKWTWAFFFSLFSFSVTIKVWFKVTYPKFIVTETATVMCLANEIKSKREYCGQNIYKAQTFSWLLLYRSALWYADLVSKKQLSDDVFWPLHYFSVIYDTRCLKLFDSSTVLGFLDFKS